MLPQLVTSIPGPKSLALAKELRRHESRNITYVDPEWPIFWQKAEGTNVWDADGNRFLDLTSAFGVASLGHGNPKIRQAMEDQAANLWHAMGDVHPTQLKAQLCHKLSELTFERWGVGAGKTILGNSGFEAIEAALKTSLLYSGKPGIIAFSGAYHGLGFGALEAGGIPYFKDPFRRQLKEFATFVPYPHCYRCPNGIKEGFRLEGGDFPNCSNSCLLKLREQIDEILRKREIGAILVEPIQGRGGTVVPPRDFLRLLRQICDEEKILLIVDEVFTGFNRTGKLFASDHSEVIPDLICLGKALTGGFPLSACVGRSAIMDSWPDSAGEALHTSTFLGNPLGCAMALASLEQHANPELAQHVLNQGAYFKRALAKLQSPRIGNIRGAGLMIGMEIIAADGSPDGAFAVGLMKNALTKGLILLSDSPTSNVISFAPPFQISNEEIDFTVETVSKLL